MCFNNEMRKAEREEAVEEAVEAACILTVYLYPCFRAKLATPEKECFKLTDTMLL